MGPATQCDILDRGLAAFGEGLDVVQLQPSGLAAPPPMGVDEGATHAVAFGHRSLDGGGYVPGFRFLLARCCGLLALRPRVGALAFWRAARLVALRRAGPVGHRELASQ